MKEQDLTGYRSKLAKIDDEIIELLVKRFNLTDEIGAIKKKHNIPVENKEVESKLLARLIVASHNKIDSALIFKIYTEIFSESKERQRKI